MYPHSPPPADRRAVHYGAYVAVGTILGVIAAVVSFLWFFAATMASDVCHGDDARDICTTAGQHWVVLLPFIALGSAALAGITPVVAVELCHWRATWVWVGVPLSIAAYVAVPYLANAIRSAGLS